MLKIKKNNISRDLLYISPLNGASYSRTKFLIQYLINQKINLDTIFLDEKNSILEENNLTFFKLRNNRVRILKRSFYEFLCGIEISIKILFKRPKKILLSSPPFICTLTAGLTCSFFKFPYILDIRDLYPEVLFELGLIKKDSLLGKILKSLTKILYKNAEKIFTVNQSLKNKISNYVSGDKITIIPNGFDSEIFKISKEKYQNFTVVYHGILGRLHDIELIQEVARLVYEKNPKIDFLVIGDGPKRNLLEETKLPNLTYVGKKNFEEIPLIISKAHLGFSPIMDNNLGKMAFPVKIFEYIGSGLPVISTPICPIGNILEENQIGFQFENKSPDLISQKIIELYENEVLYLKICGNLNLIRDKFTRENSAKIFFNEISSLIVK